MEMMQVQRVGTNLHSMTMTSKERNLDKQQPPTKIIMISLTLVAGEINYYQVGMRICRFHGFEMFRQRGSIECSNNVHIPKQQTPSKQALWEVGCVEKLTNIINSNIFYILGGIAAVAFMGK